MLDSHRIVLLALCLGLCAACDRSSSLLSPITSPSPTSVSVASPRIQTVIEAAIAQVNVTQSYDPAYVAIAYPGGDVPISTGVCTDVVIRAYRKVGLDLQQTVHEDMQQNFAAYPTDWGLSTPDANIDHRRVPNLMTFFKRRGKSLPVTQQVTNYQPGDVVTWDLGGGQWHIGIVSNLRSPSGKLLIVHNVGAGTKLEDVLLNWQILGHYRGIETI
jgi:uncharacterized protein